MQDLDNLIYRLQNNPPNTLKDRDAAQAIRALSNDLARAQEEVSLLKEHLQVVERWANHPGQKTCHSPAEILSVIQHYPPIKDITKSYTDGKVPTTFDPYKRIQQLEELLKVQLDVSQGLATQLYREQSAALTDFNCEVCEWKYDKHEETVEGCCPNCGEKQ